MLNGSASAQGIQQFEGHVEDAAGAAIPGVTVTIHNEGTGVDVNVTTTGAGDYTAPYLNPGTYTITAKMTGFEVVSKTHITLNVDQTSKMDFSLPIGNVSDTVTVSSEGSQIELAKADRGEIIETERVQEMPLDGRNSLQLFALSPGTQIVTNPLYSRLQDNLNQGLIANGISIVPVAQILDGLTNDNAGNYTGYNPPLDSISQFKVTLNAYDASYGRSAGSSVDISLKTGTNLIHGDIYEYARRPYLDANSWVNNFSRISKVNHSRDQFGAELDGPVYLPHLYNGKDKTFFLMQFEQSYETLPNPGPTISSIPNPQWLTGNFAGAQYFDSVTQTLMPLIIYDPLSPLTTFVDPADGKTKMGHTPFPNNMIPANRIDPVGQALAQYYNGITPNYNPGGGNAAFQNNFYFVQVETDVSRNGTFKLDQVFGPHDRGSIRWGGFERYDQANPNGIPASDPANQISSQVQPSELQFAIQEIHTFSPNLITNNKAIVSTYKQRVTYGDRGNFLPQLGFSQNFISNAFQKNMIPYVNATGYIPLSYTTPGRENIAHEVAYEPDVTYIRGRHALRAGFDMRLFQYTTTAPGQNNQFGFTPTFTGELGPNYAYAPGLTAGSSIASLLLGDPNTATTANQISPFYSQHYFGMWAQDDWKATSKLTLNIGVRYDLLGARVERHNQLNGAFNTTTVNPISSQITNPTGLNLPLLGGLTFAGVNGAPRGAYATNLLHIQPRFGAAYAFSDRTSLRFGFGEFFINDESIDTNNGFASSTTYTNSLNNGITPYGNLSNPFPTFVQPSGPGLGLATSVGGGLSFINPNYKVPSVWQYSASVEQLLSRRDTLDISFSSTRAYGLPGSDDINHVSTAWYAQCDVERGGNRQLCDGTGAPAKVVNPFYHAAAFAGTSYGSLTTISSSAFTRPFPEFTSITENNLNLIHSWYNSMQVTASHRVAQNLSFHFAYTWSKNMQEGNIIDTVNRVYGRSLQANDRPTIITLSGVYFLPVGRGRAFLGNTNRLLDAAIGGWEVSPLYVYTGGNPWFPGASNNPATNNFEQISSLHVPMQQLPYDLTHAYLRIRGANPCVGYEDSDTPGLIHPGPAYLLAGCTNYTMIRQEANPTGSFAPDYSVMRNIVYTGVRYPASHQFDVSLSKRFSWNERSDLQLRLDAINVLNHANFSYSGFGDGYSNDPTNTNWGTISKGPQGPGNPARELQISGKFAF